jgi:hypothetical protein
LVATRRLTFARSFLLSTPAARTKSTRGAPILSDVESLHQRALR